MRGSILLVLVLALVSPANGNENETTFPILEGKELRVHFWVSVFTHYSVVHRIIHDDDAPERIYRVIDLSQIDPEWGMSGEMLEAVVDAEVGRIADLLRTLGDAATDYDTLTEEGRRIVKLFGSPSDRRVFTRAAHRIHVQEGVRERFAAGIRRSNRYLGEIRAVLEEEGLPPEIAYLPHVESSFHPKARSKAGAVGLWQFTAGTGRQYLRVDGDVDEREDPLLSTRAAVRHLKNNYRRLGSWPLALTAYNYGLNGMQRIVRRWGTDLGRIIDRHRGRRFGYASKNFYLEFLAAVRVAENACAYLGCDGAIPAPRLKRYDVSSPPVSTHKAGDFPVCDTDDEDVTATDRGTRSRNEVLPCRVM